MTKTQKRLLLFDIDGTLIHSGGAGVQALIRAFKERFGIDDDLSDIEIAGMTAEVAAASGARAFDWERLARSAFKA